MLTEAQLAAELQISTRQVQRYTAAGMAPAVYLWAGRRGRPLSAQDLHRHYTSTAPDFESHRTIKRWRALQTDHVCVGFED